MGREAFQPQYTLVGYEACRMYLHWGETCENAMYVTNSKTDYKHALLGMETGRCLCSILCAFSAQLQTAKSARTRMNLPCFSGILLSARARTRVLSAPGLLQAADGASALLRV